MTSIFGFISFILAAITSTLGIPIVLCSACICLLIFESATLSLSIKTIFPIPALTSASAQNDPTPPIPNTATQLLFSFSTALLPIKSPVLSSKSNMQHPHLKHKKPAVPSMNPDEPALAGGYPP